MSNGRLEGVIRWSVMSPDMAIISRGTEDYFASFMDLTTPVKPADGDKVIFTPQLVNGCYKARKIAFKPKPQQPLKPYTQPLTQPSAPPTAKVTPIATGTIKPAATATIKCNSCLSLVTPRCIRVSKGKFQQRCPKCDSALDGSSNNAMPLGLIAVLLLGVAVLSLAPELKLF